MSFPDGFVARSPGRRGIAWVGQPDTAVGGIHAATLSRATVTSGPDGGPVDVFAPSGAEERSPDVAAFTVPPPAGPPARRSARRVWPRSRCRRLPGVRRGGVLARFSGGHGATDR